MIKRSIFLCCLLLWLGLSFSVTIQIGNGNLLNQCLPCEPLLNYSYSQSLYTAAEITSAGTISSVAYQYRISSTTFLAGNNLISLYLGTVSRDRFASLTDWVPLDSLQLVFQGTLQAEWFSSVLPGQGWLTIPLTVNYIYSGTGNLVVAFDENSPGNGSTGDDFYCSSSSLAQSLEIHSMTVNPDPASPPPAYHNNPYNPLSVRPNLRLELQPHILTPYNPSPANQAVEIDLNPTLSWQSEASSWEVWFAPANQPLQQVANNLTNPTWTTPSSLALLTEYHWQVIAHSGENTFPSEAWAFTTRGETLTAPRNLTAMTVGMQVRLTWQPPSSGTIVSYNILRNTQLLANSQDTLYTDSDVLPNQTYWYQVAAVNYLNQISPPCNAVSVTIPGTLPLWLMSFEDQPDFATSLPAWTMYDLDGSNTWQWSDINFPQEGSPCSWLVFNPAQTNPPLTSLNAYSGAKFLLCPDATTPPNNDWLISPALNIQNGYQISFWTRSVTSDYGLERLRCLISVTDTLPASFVPLSNEPWLTIPAVWTQICYDLSAYAGRQVRLAWQCVSYDAFALCLDEIALTQIVGNQDEVLSPPFNFQIYPNPARNWFQIKGDGKTPFTIGIYNLKGQKLIDRRGISSFTWTKNPDKYLPAGVYIVKIESENARKNIKLLLY